MYQGLVGQDGLQAEGICTTLCLYDPFASPLICMLDDSPYVSVYWKRRCAAASMRTSYVSDISTMGGAKLGRGPPDTLDSEEIALGYHWILGSPWISLYALDWVLGFSWISLDPFGLA